MNIKMKDFFSTQTAVMEVAFDEPQSDNNLASGDRSQGVYGRLGDNCIGLFVQDRKLFLYLNGIASETRDSHVMVSFHSEGERRWLSITVGGSVTTIAYSNSQLPVSTQFYSEDEEDSDFGLWLTNVLGSDERRKIFIQSWQMS
jgi:hypothetical protein